MCHVNIVSTNPNQPIRTKLQTVDSDSVTSNYNNYAQITDYAIT